MDDYQMEELKRAFEVIYKDWEQSVSLPICIHIHPGPCVVHCSRCSLRRVISHARPSSESLFQLRQFQMPCCAGDLVSPRTALPPLTTV
jgi:hypothetical protein